MNKFLLLIFVIISTTTCAKRPSTPKPGRAENAKIVLGSIARIIGSIGAIMDNRRDNSTISDAITDIVDNIVKITVNAVHNKSINTQEADLLMDHILAICDKIDPQLVSRIHITKRQLSLL